MKKLIAMTLALLLLLCGCGASQPAKTEETAPADTAEQAAEDNTAEAAPEEEAPAEEAQEETPAEPAGDPVELIVFAAASMNETLTQIGEQYMTDHPEVTIQFNFDSSGTLKSQIESGADCDIFISAGQKQMNQLDIEADPEVNTDGLDFVIEETRANILENKVTLCVPDGNPANVESFDNMAQQLKDGTILLAMGNEDVPVGQYTQKILAYYDLDEAQLAADGKITYGTNVKEVTSQVSEGAVSCGVIYCTDAFSAGLTPVDYATADMCGQVIYPAAVMKSTANEEAAKAFLDYCFSEDAMTVFESVGFSRVN